MSSERKPNAGIRLGSIFLDHCIMTMICLIFFIPFMIQAIASGMTISHEQNGLPGLTGIGYYLAVLGFALYFCKDCINGRSIAKRITGLQTLDYRTGQVATPLKCFIRNLSCIIWPVELIAVLVNPQRRLGDRLAGTIVAYYDPRIVQQPAFNFKETILPITLSFGCIILLMLPIKHSIPSFSKIDIVEHSYNANESRALEKLYTDSMGQQLEASVRIYDTVRGLNLKYISLIYSLKENYLRDENSSHEIADLTMHYLYSMFPKNTIKGRAQYVYAGSDERHTWKFEF